MKNNSGKVTLAAVLTIAALIFGLFSTNVKPSNATYSASPTPSCGTETYYFYNEGSNNRVDINVHGSDEQIDAEGLNGWTISNLWLDQEGGSTTYISIGGGNRTNYNPSNFGDIDKVKVEVTKSCATPTTSPTPQGISVNICHQAGQSGNYTHNTVSVHSVNDANGLNGHGDHDGDIWAPFTYNNVNYLGQGNYGSFNMSTCVQNSSPTPTATATSQPTYSPTATPTEVPVPTPTDDPCEEEDECYKPTSTPVATVEPTATPNGDICANLDGIQLTMPDEYHQAGVNCLKYELGGPPPPPAASNTQVLGASTSRVLGASTMAGTGAVEDALFNSIFTFGSLLTSFGIMKNGKKRA